MKVTGGATVHASVPMVWDALRNPVLLARTIPGCSALDAVGPDTYRMIVAADVAQVTGTYVTQVRFTGSDPHRSYTLQVSAQGAPGTLAATVSVQLSDTAAADGFAGATRVGYDCDMVAHGLVGGVGQRVLAGAVQKTAGKFFAAVDRALADDAPTAQRGEVTADPARQVRASLLTDHATWPIVAAFGAGSAAALAGVALGRVVARRKR